MLTETCSFASISGCWSAGNSEISIGLRMMNRTRIEIDKGYSGGAILWPARSGKLPEIEWIGEDDLSQRLASAGGGGEAGRAAGNGAQRPVRELRVIDGEARIAILVLQSSSDNILGLRKHAPRNDA
ncbi:hypothetical protein EVAR_8625_1 [Eumeta japonica]|uniref:Uncharacterized protein n=1 Tax=Eumeta variegata TaxID=151549 RepID=A0A4C1TV29_EUMVA|nr:hypothetical protein EVAR_8625_1 [Eumeta japonica]